MLECIIGIDNIINFIKGIMYSDSSVVLFADDIALYRVITSIEDYAQLQSGIDSIADWVDESRLSLQSGKCRAMLFSRKHTPSHQPLTLRAINWNLLSSINILD